MKWFVGATLLVAARAWGQANPPMGAEWRVDALIGRHAAVEGGVLLQVPAGIYVRMGMGGATGVTWRNGAAHSATRADFITRGLFDPFRQSPVGISIGGGLTVTNAEDGRWHPFAVVALDIEGNRRGRLVPALQIGLGDGARVGLVLRSAPLHWR